ncbi:DUF1501 domain-containing protein [Roseovarius pelagicus]|uniref:DUF1501 domain-containing protein n=1 Tax=Roseovarius pelagicus TaxID=2980108 RepID=A0ABY6DDZ7_9RHOB|nr:DUF1501 domain-containing protein [Roseovarius pelagicus]UXX84382.1 DUF1501 domain-containing protein [Roseovarius pelagicus]
MTLTRRQMLGRSAALGCCLAANPLVTPVTLASAPSDNRLVVIILRGGLDGLDMVQPRGDADFSALRPGMPNAKDLDGFFALHDGLSPLYPLWQEGQLGFAHAVSTPYRDRRSHFDGQDMLEAGTGMEAIGHSRSGWLNRALAHLPGADARTAYAIGRADMLLTRGAAPVANWAPDAALTLSSQAELLLERVMHDDPLFRDATLEAIALSATDLGSTADAATSGDMMNAMSESVRAARKGAQPETIARFAATQLRAETRLAAFSLGGFDTHSRQDRSLLRALGPLATTILTLQAELGAAIWERTTIVAVTEFGRTARLNGSGGTDHGTAGAMLLAGGAVRGGRVITDWPGLAETDLYQRRDLRPTRDLRAHLGWLLAGLYGLNRTTLETEVFPGLDMGADPRLIL